MPDYLNILREKATHAFAYLTVDEARQAYTQSQNIIAAGIAVQAQDTGRVLMLQRSLSPDDPAAGKWEFPGGTLDPRETPINAAVREFQEETGLKLPSGDWAGQWTSGVYKGFIYRIPQEQDLDINLNHEDRHVLNPDDPDGDQIEVIAWWNVQDLLDNPAVREELRDTDWKIFGQTVTAANFANTCQHAMNTVIEKAEAKALITERFNARLTEFYSHAFSNDCHDPQSGRFCNVPGHPKPGPKLDRWHADNPTQAKALQTLKDRPSLGKQDVDGEQVKDAILTTADYDPSIRSEFTEKEIDALPKHEETVETNSIIATKNKLKRSTISAVIHALDQPNGPWFRPGYLPILIKKNGKNYLWDGHHRIEGARILGQKTTKVQVVDFPPTTKKKSLQAAGNPCHSPGGTPTGGQFCEAHGITAEEHNVLDFAPEAIRPALEKMLTDRRKVESHYTSLLSRTAIENSGDMIGLDFKFKEAKGILEKIDRKIQEKGISPEQSAAKIADSLRYTVAFSPENYLQGTRDTARALIKSGVKFESFETNWQKGDAYNGVNAVFVDPQTGLKIELQFHTPESFHVKDKVIHKDYEIVRKRQGTQAEIYQAFKRMQQHSDAIMFPSEISKIDTYIPPPPVTNIFRPWTEPTFAIAIAIIASAQTIPVNDWNTAYNLTEQGIMSQGDWEDWVDAATQGGYWSGEIEPNRQNILKASAIEEFYNKCHDEATGHFCEDPAHNNQRIKIEKATTEEIKAAKAKAKAWIRIAKVPSATEVAKGRAEMTKAKQGASHRTTTEDRGGSNKAREQQRHNLFKEFGGEKRGYVVDHQSGIKLHWSADPILNPNQYPVFTRGRIFTTFQGGNYVLNNILPESFPTNRARGSRPIRKENLD